MLFFLFKCNHIIFHAPLLSKGGQIIMSQYVPNLTGFHRNENGGATMRCRGSSWIILVVAFTMAACTTAP